MAFNIFQYTSKGSSCPVAIGNALLDMYKEIQNELIDSDDGEISELIAENNNSISKDSIPKVDADKSNAFEVRALKQKNDYDVQILCDKVNRLELEVDSLRNEKADLQMKLDDAYAQMRDLAAETVKSTGGVKILNGQNSQLNK